MLMCIKELNYSVNQTLFIKQFAQWPGPQRSFSMTYSITALKISVRGEIETEVGSEMQ